MGAAKINISFSLSQLHIYLDLVSYTSPPPIRSVAPSRDVRPHTQSARAYLSHRTDGAGPSRWALRPRDRARRLIPPSSNVSNLSNAAFCLARTTLRPLYITSPVYSTSCSPSSRIRPHYRATSHNLHFSSACDGLVQYLIKGLGRNKQKSKFQEGSRRGVEMRGRSK
ncbi:hypothetical protein VUR80DRAFT_865 [Thermomyces stellatus]